VTPARDWTRREGLALLTDFYELTMMAGYLKTGRHQRRACFEYFFRTLPDQFGFAVATGLEPLLQWFEALAFHDEDIDYLRSLGVFDEDFLAYLAGFDPSCTIRAVREGTVVFPAQPLVQVEGPIIECQLLETAFLNMMNYPTLIASKAARICLAAEGDPVLEFGLRRAHGPDGGLSGSRAAYIGGCSSTSNVLAGKTYGIPVAGTHAHSWVMSFDSELEAFRSFARLYPKRCVLLVDTYDTIESGVRNAITVFNEMRNEGLAFRAAIRLDSGDLAKLSKQAHQLLTEAGFDDPMIVASNELDEDLIADLKRQGARINAWGVGTQLITSANAPSLNGVYKLVGTLEASGEWQPRIKISSNVAKATNPGRKRLVRYYDADDRPIGDVLYLAGEDPVPSGTVIGRQKTYPNRAARIRDAARCEDLLETVFAGGRRLRPAETAETVRGRAQAQIDHLPEEFKRLRNPEIYRVALSETIGALKEELLRDPDSAL
jgi:nicotinate phosphoribosyltransferase